MQNTDDMAAQHFEKIAASDNTRLHVGNYYDYSTINHLQDDKKLDLRRALAFPRMERRYATIATASSKSSQWLLETPQCARWHDTAFHLKGSACLWIKGKPGAGKSTAMKSLLKRTSAQQPGSKIISFFFNARGEPLERSVEGMYRSLVYQLVSDIPQPETEAVSHEAMNEYAQIGWPLELLKDLFGAAVAHLSRQSHLICFVDALDESDIEDDVRDMVHTFAELSKSAFLERSSFSICFASRHYPHISVEPCEEIILEDQEGHKESIADYVTTRLRLGNPALEQELGFEIQRRSAGVFLWVVLVVGTLNKEANRGKLYRLREELQTMPLRINDLINEVVNREKDERLLPAVQWLLFSFDTLTAEQLYSGILISIGRNDADLQCGDRTYIDADVVKHFIISSTKGLAELTPEGGVQFIHETVREYFLEYGMEYLRPDLVEHGDVAAVCHTLLAQWCHTYFQLACENFLTDEIDSRVPQQKRSFLWEYSRTSWPFLEYARDGLLKHTELAAKHGTVDMTINKTVLSKAWLITKSYGRDDEFYQCALEWKPTMLHVLVFEACRSLFDAEIRNYRTFETQLSLINVQSWRLGSALHVASSRGDAGMVQVLLDNGADVDARSSGGKTPLHFAVDPGCSTAVADILLHHGADIHACTEDIVDSPLHLAINVSTSPMVLHMLHRSARRDSKRKDDGLTLRLAIKRFMPVVIDALLSHGCSVDANTGNGCTALHATAVYYLIPHREQILRLLLSRGADVNAQCPEHGTALHIAVSTARVDVVNLLLSYGADANLFCGNHGTVLNIAILKSNTLVGNRSELLATLLAHSRNLLEPIGESGNAIEAASRMNDYEVMRALMIHGIDVQADDFSETGPYENPDIARRFSGRLLEEVVVDLTGSPKHTND